MARNKPKHHRESSQVNRIMSASYSGPLPLPSDFEGYERVVPGAADRILTMAETQQKELLKQASKEQEANIKENRRAQWFAFILGLFVIGGIVFLINADKTIMAFAFMAVSGIVTAFVSGGKKRDKRDT